MVGGGGVGIKKALFKAYNNNNNNDTLLFVFLFHLFRPDIIFWQLIKRGTDTASDVVAVHRRWTPS